MTFQNLKNENFALDISMIKDTFKNVIHELFAKKIDSFLESSKYSTYALKFNSLSYGNLIHNHLQIFLISNIHI